MTGYSREQLFNLTDPELAILDKFARQQMQLVIQQNLTHVFENLWANPNFMELHLFLGVNSMSNIHKTQAMINFTAMVNINIAGPNVQDFGIYSGIVTKI